MLKADYYPAAKDEDSKDRDEEDDVEVEDHDVEDDERDKNLENPWSPLSSGERCKCEGHFSDLKDGHNDGQRGHGHQNVTSRSRLFTWEIHISYLKS